MTYDESIKEAEAIIAQLEQAQALSMDEYNRLSKKAAALLNQCKAAVENLQ